MDRTKDTNLLDELIVKKEAVFGLKIAIWGGEIPLIRNFKDDKG